MGKKNEEVKHQGEEIKKHKKEKGSKSEKKHKDKEGGFFETAINVAEKAVPIIKQVLPFVKIAVDKLFNKKPEKITDNLSEQETIAAIASNESSLSAITNILENTVAGLIVEPSGEAKTDNESKAESIELKLPKPLRDHDYHHLTNIINHLIQTLGKVVDKSPDTKAAINTNTVIAIDNSGAKPIVKVTPNDRMVITDASLESNIEEVTTEQLDLIGNISDLNVEDHV